MKKIILVLLLFTVLPLNAISKEKKIKQGIWRAALKISENKLLPFNFNYDKTEHTVTIFNADEKITLNTLHIKGKNFTLSFPIFNSEIIGTIDSKKLIHGYWHNYSKGPDYKIPLSATYGINSRFNTQTNNSKDFIGKWEVTFDYTNDKEKAIGLFDLKNQTIHGTFLTETGDYRFLEGVSFNDSLKLSCFDGTHAFLFNAKLVNDTLWGDFYSGIHYHTNWFAVKNEDFELRDPEKLTYLVDTKPLMFNARDLNDNDYLFPNPTVENKVVIIQILGTWCPNCLDETNYLKTLYDKYQENIEIIGVGFEVGKTNQEKIEKLLTYKNYLNIKYPLILGGNACKPCAEDVFPMLNGIMSFPTLIILDKNHNVRKIHTGFSGPSTGSYYTDFVTHTTMFIEQLIKEN
jgi:thiol-disulfide isomerase/thioredoxin